MHCNFDIQYSFEDLLGENNEKLRFDFAILNKHNSLFCLIEIDDEEHRANNIGNTPRQLKRQEARKRDVQKDNCCKRNNIQLYRMQVPFICSKKWSHEDYYRYVNTELKRFVNMANREEKC